MYMSSYKDNCEMAGHIENMHDKQLFHKLMTKSNEIYYKDLWSQIQQGQMNVTLLE